MQEGYLLDRFPLWLLFAASVGLVVVPAEIGYRLGRLAWHRRRHEEKASVETLVSPALGLLAFILAFTFSLAQTRFEARRTTQLEAANAIGTAYMRASFAPAPLQSEIKRLLRAEVDVYLGARDPATMRRAVQRLEAVHDTLWRITAGAAAGHPESLLTGLLVQSINEVIDSDERHVNARIYGRIPWAIWAAIGVLAVIAMTLMGYHSGMTGTRRSPAMVPVAIGFCVVIFLIADLDRPHVGLLTTSRAVILELRSSLGSN